MILQGHVKYFCCCTTRTATYMTTKLGKVVTHYNNLQRINSHNILKASSRDKLKTFCLHITIPMTTKPVRVIIYNEELPFQKVKWPWSSNFDFVYIICRVKTKTPKLSPTFCSPACSPQLFWNIREFEVEKWNEKNAGNGIANTMQIFSGRKFFLVYSFSEHVGAKGNPPEAIW